MTRRHVCQGFGALVVLGVVPSAWGATRYAAPGASGPEPCAEANPCRLERAVEDAPNHNDEVVVAPGDYEVSGGAGPDCSAGFSPGALAPSKRLTIRGVPGQPRPRISAASGNCATLNSDWGGTLRHLELRQPNTTSGGMALAWYGLLDDLVIRSESNIAMALSSSTFFSTTFTNSAVSGKAPLGPQGSWDLQVMGPSVTLRNLTVEGGVLAIALTVPSGTAATATNVIAMQGFWSRWVSGGESVLTVDHSYGPLQFVTQAGLGRVVNGGNNQCGIHYGGTSNTQSCSASPPPQFLDRPAGDFHQLTASPTLNAGANPTSMGEKDFDGGDRQIGTTDIGADEFDSASATVMTSAASGVAHDSATLNGMVNPNGVSTAAYFEYGLTSSYGSQTATANVASDFAWHGVSDALTGLPPDTSYHYRIVGTNGQSLGPDFVVTTSATPDVIFSDGFE